MKIKLKMSCINQKEKYSDKKRKIINPKKFGHSKNSISYCV